MGWILLSVIYLVLLCTVAIMTFRKGHWILGLIGFIFPLLTPGQIHAEEPGHRHLVRLRWPGGPPVRHHPH